MRPRQKNDILQGTLALLVLQTLATNGSMHGYAITQRIQTGAENLLRVEEGSVYPALHRMAQQGFIKGKWGTTEKKREALFYTITAAGRRQLVLEQKNWARLTKGVSRVLGYT